ncbi:MAG: hypothetical protein ACE37F_10660 [Nannocystaceae bacterium]|nr:hypothetical protein [bacterium]
MGRLRSVAVSLALLAPLLVPQDAVAENGVKPRIPVTWEPAAPCLEFVDRSADPVYRFEYSIFDEDPSPGEALLPDEVADSRRHQFFAFSRQGNPQTEFPYNWITPADVTAAIEKNLISETTVGPDETLETSPLWQGRFVRITPDDARRPIAHESVAEPVQWDTSTADAGVYMLWGYTWEPAFNEWSQRYGNVVIVHDGDASAVGPAAAITNGELIVYSDEAAVVEGCVFADEGTTVDAYFSETPPNDATPDWQPTWVNVVEGQPVGGDAFTVEFMPGGGHSTPTLLVRLVFNDPSGRSYEAHMPFLLNVLPGSAGGCDTDGEGGFIGMPGCGDGTDGSDSEDGGDTDEGTTGSGPGSDTSGSASAGSTGGPASAGGSGGDSGGTCAVQPGRTAPAWLLLLLGLFGVRRRRR